MNLKVELRAISPQEARPLRNSVLRPGLPVETCVYPGDDAPTSYHQGAFQNGKLLGVTSMIFERPPFATSAESWRLRGVAVLPEARRQGIGKLLVRACIEHAGRQGGSLMWCVSRTNVVDFYCSLGFQTTGDAFNIPVSGAHFFMWRPIMGQLNNK